MPELPDVQIFKEYFDSTSLHQEIEEVSVEDDAVLEGLDAEELRSSLEGREFVETRRHGKHLFVSLAEEFLRLHFGMTGSLAYFKNKEERPEYVRVDVLFRNGYHLVFDCPRKLGRIGIVSEVENFLQEAELGPDALALSGEEFIEILKRSRGGTKSFLMNQKRIAGIGNVYSDEMLFHSRIRPDRELPDLAEEEVVRLDDSRVTVLEKAIECRVKIDRFPSGYLLSHREPGATCPRCEGTIQKETIAGRSSYFCESCQE